MSGALYWDGGGLGNRGTHGFFWVSTLNSYTHSRYLNFHSTSVSLKNTNYKPYGFPLRCVAQFKISQKSHLCSTSIEFRNFLPCSKFFRFVSSRALRSLPLSVMLSGGLYWLNGNLNDRGTNGYFWASTPNSYTHSRRLGFGSTNVVLKNDGYKPGGFTLRCVAQTTYAIIKIAILVRERSKVLLNNLAVERKGLLDETSI